MEVQILGPSHHIFFEALHRRGVWLDLLTNTHSSDVEVFTAPKLEQILDDTPADSFLTNKVAQLTRLEEKVFSNLSSHHQAEKLCIDWGRRTFQESLLSKRFCTELNVNSLRGIYEMIQIILLGGHFFGTPLLLRRYTDSELQYECQQCPHERFGHEYQGRVSDLACKLEGKVVEGFVRAAWIDVKYSRKRFQTYCLDEIRRP